MISLVTASDDINHQRKFCDCCFSASDDINIRQNSIIRVFLHLMILTSDKLQWHLFYCICSYKHQRNFNNFGFSAPDDINIRQNLMIAFFLYLMILTSDKI